MQATKEDMTEVAPAKQKIRVEKAPLVFETWLSFSNGAL